MRGDQLLASGLQTLDAKHGSKLGKAAPALLQELEFDMADDLTVVDIPDELVEGVLTRGAMSVVYGDSNSGKTFLSIDVGCSISLGTSWMGRRVEPGLVVYLAAESPQSVRTRLLAYQRENAITVTRFAIVKSPVDLFAGEADTEAVIALIKKLEAVYRAKVHLVIGDTLARLSAGANENSGEDMGIVVRHIDYIREQCNTHFLLIHHCGKDTARGMRGWSGLRAATDTEIEVTADQDTGMHAAEITKQRDIPGKGDRIGFRLQSVELGRNKWDKPITSCIVLAADAPEKQTQSRRTSEIAGAILEVLTSRGSGMRKGAVVEHFDGRYAKSAIYRELKKLVDGGKVNEVTGLVAIRRDQ